MIIVRKDQLKLVSPDHIAMKTPPEKYDFETNLSSARNITNILFDVMDECGGIGLSANQLGLNLRVFVMGKGENKLAVFNPEILEYIGEDISFKEGCLSYPGLFLDIKRPRAISVRFFNENGVMIETIFSGISARVFLHEYEHMQGKDFTYGVSKLKLDFAKKKYKNKKNKIVKKHAETTMLNALKGQ